MIFRFIFDLRAKRTFAAGRTQLFYEIGCIGFNIGA